MNYVTHYALSNGRFAFQRCERAGLYLSKEIKEVTCKHCLRMHRDAAALLHSLQNAASALDKAHAEKVSTLAASLVRQRAKRGLRSLWPSNVMDAAFALTQN